MRISLVYKRGSIAVKYNDKLIGIVTERDLLKRVLAHDLNPHSTRLSEIMSKTLIIVDAEDDIEKARDIMDKHRVRRIFVAENGEVKGILSIRQIIQHLRYSNAVRLSEEEHIRPAYLLREI